MQGNAFEGIVYEVAVAAEGQTINGEGGAQFIERRDKTSLGPVRLDVLGHLQNSQESVHIIKLQGMGLTRLAASDHQPGGARLLSNRAGGHSFGYFNVPGGDGGAHGIVDGLGNITQYIIVGLINGVNDKGARSNRYRYFHPVIRIGIGGVSHQYLECLVR